MKTSLKIALVSLVSLLIPVAFASAATISISNLSPGTTVNSGNEVYFSIPASGFSTIPTYTVSDSFNGTSVSNSNISVNNVDSSGTFVWLPTASDSGTHNLTITATDAVGNTASVSEQIIVTGPPTVNINSLSPGASVTVGNPVFFSTTVSNFTNPTFSVNDAFPGSTMTGSAINSAGGFSWTPTINDIGSHTINVVVTDSSGHSASASISVSVTATASLSIQSITPSPSISPGQQITLAVAPTGFSGTVYYTVNDSSSVTSFIPANVSQSGSSFSWTPTINDTGSHTITIHATDSAGDVAATSTTITVSNSNPSIILTAPLPSSTVSPGTAVAFSATSYGFTSPTFTVADLKAGSSITSVNINASSGAFSWVPSINDAGTHTIVIAATDGYNHSASAEVQITVTGTGTTATTGASNTSSNSTGYVFTLSLSLGSSNAQVTALQNLLTQQGFYSGPVTGYYGSLTATAVEKFQTAHGLSAVGIVGPATRAALNGSATTTTQATTTASTNDGFKFSNPLSLGSSGNDVTELQKRLTAEGVYSGPITGYYGALTMSAVKTYQGNHGINQLGNVGPATRASLNGN